MYTRQNKNTTEKGPSPATKAAGKNSAVFSDNRQRSLQQRSTISEVAQRMPADYDKIRSMEGKWVTVEYKEHAEWIRLKGKVSNVKNTSIYIGNKRFVKNWIEEEDFRIVSLEEGINEAIGLNVYGTDTGKLDNEIADAYQEGQRDFDCAYSYHKGKTYQLFQAFPINRGEARIVYKFKFEDLAGAAEELTRLSRIKGVIIHTIMLHELPEKDLKKALDHLVFLGKMFQCHIGVSNVEITGLDIETDLPNLVQQLAQRGVKLPVVENKMNPGEPDKKVREYCYQHGIQYLAYGLTGPSLSAGTCGLVPGAKQGAFKFLSDPEIVSLSEKLNIKPDDLRYVVYTWARNKKVSVISRSSQPKRRAQNRNDVQIHPELQQALDDFGSDDALYPPLVKYLRKAGVPVITIEQLPDYIDPAWLKIYYNKAVIEWKDEGLKNVLLTRFDKLKTAQGRNNWKDLTNMREWLGNLVLISDEPAKQMSAVDLFNAASQIYFETIDDELEAISSAKELSEMVKDVIVNAKIGVEYHKYISQGDGNFVLK